MKQISLKVGDIVKPSQPSRKNKHKWLYPEKKDLMKFGVVTAVIPSVYDAYVRVQWLDTAKEVTWRSDCFVFVSR